MIINFLRDLPLNVCNTLLTKKKQVLHDSSPKDGGTQISTLIQERDNLSKQLVMFQNDREQIVAALGAKHQESVAYHAEVQRLNELMSTEGHKQDVLQQEYSSLRKQYTDKQQVCLCVYSCLCPACVTEPKAEPN